MTALKTILAMEKMAAPLGCRLNPALRTAIEQQVVGAHNELADLCAVGEADSASTPNQFAEDVHHAES